MSYSIEERRTNLHLALCLMMDGLKEPFEWQEHDARSPKFAAIHRTTWEELQREGFVKPHRFDRYELTPTGWIAGLKATREFSDPELQRKAGLLSQALKVRIDGRQDWGFADRTDLARETGLPEFFIYNVIDSHLLRELFGRIDAASATDDRMKNCIDIPPDFGYPLLAHA